MVYYYAYDADGKRQGPWSTKCLTLTEAQNYCHRLIRGGALLPKKKKALTFGEFAKGFWEGDSEYIKY